jgi:hypothetical protein
MGFLEHAGLGNLTAPAITDVASYQSVEGKISRKI